MIEGTLEIQCKDQDKLLDARTYWVSFLAYAGFQSGAHPHMEIVGEESLLNYLVRTQAANMPIEWRTRRAQEWLLEVHSAGHLSLDNWQFTEEQYKAFQPFSR
jgi:hypothetical protein